MLLPREQERNVTTVSYSNPLLNAVLPSVADYTQMKLIKYMGKNLLNAEKLKYTWINAGGDVLNCYRHWQHQLREHSVNV
jgi:hypothetical protein